MLILQTIIYFLVFVFLAFWIFYALGFQLIGRRSQDLAHQEVIALSLCVGLVLFVLLAVLLGLLHLRNLMLPILILNSIWIILHFKTRFFKPWHIFIEDKLLLFMIVVGIVTLGMINFPSGFSYHGQLLFWSSQGHDGLWHVSLIEEIKKNFPPRSPLFAGDGVYNYHYLIDIAMGEFNRIFPFFTSLDIYFRFFPTILALMIGMATFSFVNRWQNSRPIAYLAVFFTYFTGSFGYVVNFLKQGNIWGGETVFWAAQGNTILGNPPHATSYSLIPAFFLSLLIFFKKRDKFWFVISFAVAGILAGFKVSGGLVVLVGLGAATLVDLIVNRKKSLLLLTVCLGISNFITFKVLTRGGESLLMFLPWWFVRTMVVAGNRLDWIDLENRRQHYLSKGTWHAYLRVGQLEMTAFLIFLVGNLGARIIGILELTQDFGKKIKTTLKNPLEVGLAVTMLTGFVVPMLFVQKGIIYNNIQFMQYFLLIFGFYAAITVYKLVTTFKNPLVKVIILLIIFALSVPTVIGNMVEFYGPKAGPLAKIDQAQLQALKYLKDNSKTDAIILNVPFNKYLQGKFNYQPRPIYAWYSTPYIPAIASRRTYLSAEEQVLITNYPLKDRREKMEKFFSQEDFAWNIQFLKEAGIDYIYVSKDEIDQPLDVAKNNLEKFFENSEVIVYKTKT